MLLGCGNFGARVKPPKSGLFERGSCLGHGCLVENDSERRLRNEAGERGLKLRALRFDLRTLLAIVLGHTAQQVAERRHSMASVLGKISAAEERLLFRGGQKHGQGPPARTVRQHLLRDLINLIQVRALFAVDFDVDEQLVHQGRGGRIFEGFVGHHMAPMAGRIADRQENGLVLLLCPPQGRLAPGIPLHRIVGVLQQVRAGLLGEVIAQHVHGLVS